MKFHRKHHKLKIITLFLIVPYWNTGLSDEFGWSHDDAYDCIETLYRFEWENQLWPSVNNSPKPSFESRFSNEFINQKSQELYLKEYVLANEFGVTLSKKQIQTELNRIVLNTRNPNHLKRLFNMFENDANKIANCLVKSLLIQKHIDNNYYWNNELHGELKLKAEIDLSRFKGTGDTNAIVSEHEYVSAKAVTPNEVYTMDFEDGLEPASENIAEIKQSKYGFYYTTIVDDQPSKLKKKTLFWKKQSLEQWLSEKPMNFRYKTVGYSGFELPKLNEVKSIYGDYWETSSLPIERSYQTAVWTGTHMFVYGGGYYRSFHVAQIGIGELYDPESDTWTRISTEGAPSNRDSAHSFWTGEEVIVWGGINYDGQQNDGAFYNPATDTWRPISSINAPIARNDDSVVFTGDALIVWGGYEEDEYVNTGYSYNLENNSWTEISRVNAPAKRSSHTAVWTGDEMIVWGGYGGFEFGSLNDGAAYNPVNDTWRTISNVNAPTPRRNPYQAWTGDEVVIWGGRQGENLNVGGRYSPSEDKWTSMTGLNAPDTFNSRFGSDQMTWTGTEIVVWGGYNQPNGARYNAKLDSWSTITSTGAPASRVFFTNTWTGDEFIVWGGRTYDGEDYDFIGSYGGGRYDPELDAWTRIHGLPYYRENQESIWTGNNYILWGGYDSGVINLGSIYNPMLEMTTDTSIDNAATERRPDHLFWTGSEMLVWGGTILENAARFNPITNSWSPITNVNAPESRDGYTGVWTGNEMIVFGKEIAPSWNTGGIYNPSDDSWVLTSTDNAPYMAKMQSIWTGSEMIIWGSERVSPNASVVRPNGFRYNPVQDMWNQLPLNGGPTSRSDFSLVWTNTEAIIWGGTLSSIHYQDGYAFNPITNQWRHITGNGGPYRRGHDAVWTGLEMIVLGGFDEINRTYDGGYSYNPVNNSWFKIAEFIGPWGSDTISTWTGEKVIYWGRHKHNRIGFYTPRTELIFVDGYD